MLIDLVTPPFACVFGQQSTYDRRHLDDPRVAKGLEGSAFSFFGSPIFGSSIAF